MSCTCDSPGGSEFPHRPWCATEHRHPSPDCPGLCEPDPIDDARRAAAQLLRMEREHTGTGREGHLSETDLRPLLHALGIDTEETP